MKLKILYCLLISFVVITCQSEHKFADKPLINSAQKNEIDHLGYRYLALNRFSGVLAIVRNNEIIYENYFGLADYEKNTSFNTNTAFKIGEISELITAKIIEEMANNNRLKVTETISTYIPEINADFTIGDLLDKKTSLPSITQIQEENPYLSYTTVNFTNRAIQSSITADGSDLNFNILGLLIEKISGKDFQKNIEDYSKSLELENTYYKHVDTTLAIGYLYHNYRGKGLELQKAPAYNLDIAFSSRGLKSTVKDIAKIVNSISNKKINIEGYVQNDGFSYAVKNDPEKKECIIVLSNRRHPVADEISNTIKAILENKPYRIPLNREPITLESEVLDSYAGNYELNERVKFEVIREGDSLFVLLGPNKVMLLPQSENQFYMLEQDAAMRFEKGQNSKVNSVVLLNGFIDSSQIAIKTN